MEQDGEASADRHAVNVEHKPEGIDGFLKGQEIAMRRPQRAGNKDITKNDQQHQRNSMFPDMLHNHGPGQIELFFCSDRPGLGCIRNNSSQRRNKIRQEEKEKQDLFQQVSIYIFVVKVRQHEHRYFG